MGFWRLGWIGDVAGFRIGGIWGLEIQLGKYDIAVNGIKASLLPLKPLNF